MSGEGRGMRGEEDREGRGVRGEVVGVSGEG